MFFCAFCIFSCSPLPHESFRVVTQLMLKGRQKKTSRNYDFNNAVNYPAQKELILNMLVIRLINRYF